ncbi:hypothetical protein D9M71_15360 [compost metagenome]|jgi:hypothetical protein
MQFSKGTEIEAVTSGRELFCKLKNFAMHNDKIASSFVAMTYLCASVINSQ